MKKLIYVMAILLLTSLMGMTAQAQETCETVKQDVNTPVPDDLKGATIIVRTKDGKEVEMKAEEFKVVKRKQQFKVTKQVAKAPTVIERVVEKEVIVEVPRKEKKNMLIGGLSYDYTSLSTDMSSNGTSSTVKLYSNKGPIFDIGYMRRKLFDSNFAGGIGVNTNVAPRVFLGYEF